MKTCRQRRKFTIFHCYRYELNFDPLHVGRETFSERERMIIVWSSYHAPPINAIVIVTELHFVSATTRRPKAFAKCFMYL